MINVIIEMGKSILNFRLLFSVPNSRHLFIQCYLNLINCKSFFWTSYFKFVKHQIGFHNESYFRVV